MWNGKEPLKPPSLFLTLLLLILCSLKATMNSARNRYQSRHSYSLYCYRWYDYTASDSMSSAFLPFTNTYCDFSLHQQPLCTRRHIHSSPPSLFSPSTYRVAASILWLSHSPGMSSITILSYVRLCLGHTLRALLRQSTAPRCCSHAKMLPTGM